MKTAITMFMFFLMSICNTFAQDSTHLNYIIPDFQVNENPGIYSSIQSHPSIASDSSGNFVIAWYDERDQSRGIYAQRYRYDGEPLGSNFKVNYININNDYSIPKICVDKKGDFVITWNNGALVFVQRYSNNGANIENNLIVNEYKKAKVGSPSVSMDEKGNFIIVWEGGKEGEIGADIFAQLFTNDGNALGNNFNVSPGHYPSVSSDHKGNFVITWAENKDIYAQRYTSEGVLSGGKIKVNDNSTSSGKPSVATEYNGNFTIVWGNNAQRFSKDGTKIGNNFKVFNIIDQYFSSVYSFISTNENGDYVIVWNDVDSEKPWFYSLRSIYACRYSSNGIALGDPFKVTTYWGPLYDYIYDFNNSISVNNDGSFVVTWYDGNETDGGDIYAQRYSADGNAVGNNFRVNDNKESASSNSSIVVDGNGNFVITWLDYRKTYEGVLHDIFIQRYSNDGTALGNNIKLNRKIDVDYDFPNKPSIAFDTAGNFVIAWDENDCIYAQRFSNNGIAIDSSFKVHDTHNNYAWQSISIAMNNNGNFVIVWFDDDIYAQRFSKEGLKIGNDLKVNDVGGGNYLNVSIDKNGNFVIVWYGDNIYAQRYASDGTRMGNNIKVNDIDDSFLGIYESSPLSMCSDENGNFIIAWHNGGYNVYTQRYLNDGTASGKNYKVNDIDSWCSSISSSLDEMGNYIIIWESWGVYTSYSNICAQRYSNDGEPINKNFIIKSDGSSPDVKLWNGRIYSTWTAPDKNNIGENVYANVIDWNNPIATSIDEKESKEIPTKFALSQNYPNPFNPRTTIKYSIPEEVISQKSKVKNVILKVYDILGREVAVLVNEVQKPGYYEVEWDASNQPSGVYFYRITTGNYAATKKMILIK